MTGAASPSILLLACLAAGACAEDGCRVEGAPGPATLRYRVGDDFRASSPGVILREIQAQLNDGTVISLEGGDSYPAGAGLSLAARGRPAAWTLAQVAAATGRTVTLRHAGGETRYVPAGAPPAPAPAPAPMVVTMNAPAPCPPHRYRYDPWPVWGVVPVVTYGVGWRVHRHGWLGWNVGMPLRDWHRHCR